MKLSNKKKRVNLHTHSNFSLDGKLNPNELINYLKENSLDIISITDHDTCEAYKHIKSNLAIKIITGIEADAIVNNHTYDFVCYSFDLDEVLNEVKDYIDGIEICNNPKNIEEVEFLYNYAKDNNLLVSCDSDFRVQNNCNLQCEYLTENMIKDIPMWID